MAFSISAYYPEAVLKESEFASALIRVATALHLAKINSVQPMVPEIEVIFMLAGTLDVPGFTGMRMGQFDQGDKRLRFETAVPKALNHSSAASDYIVAALLDAAENAADYFTERNFLFDVKSHMAMVEGLNLATAKQ
jgi:hypothetical protein